MLQAVILNGFQFLAVIQAFANANIAFHTWLILALKCASSTVMTKVVCFTYTMAFG